MHIFEHIDKKVAVAFGIIILGLLGFFFYSLSGKVAEPPQLTVLPTSPLDATLGRDLLAALAKLKSTKLDTSIFDDPVFVSLKDFGVTIASQAVGRRNPFALFEGEAAAQKGVSGKPKTPTSASTGSAKKSVSPPKPPPKVPVDGFDVP